MITGGSSAPSNTPTKEEKKLTQETIEIAREKRERLGQVTGEGTSPSPYLTGMGYRKKESTPATTVPVADEKELDDNKIKRINDINRETKDIEGQLRGVDVGYAGGATREAKKRELLDKISMLNIEKEGIQGTDTITSQTKPRPPQFGLEAMSEAERIAADPLYAQLKEAQSKYDTEIGEASRLAGISEAEVEKLIGKYNEYDTATKESIQKLTSLTDKTLLDLSGQAKILTTAQADSEKTRVLAESGIQGALSGKLPDWLEQEIRKSTDTEKERLSRFGATSGRIPEMESRIKLSAIPELLKIYEPISTQRYATTSGLSKDITGIGQTKLLNQYNLEGTGEMFKRQSLANWGNVPNIYSGLATAKRGIADDRLKQANAFNILQQQRLSDLEKYINLGG